MPLRPSRAVYLITLDVNHSDVTNWSRTLSLSKVGYLAVGRKLGLEGGCRLAYDLGTKGICIQVAI